MGLEAGRRFTAAGSTVTMVARNEARLRSEAEPLARAIPFTCDITD
ncbi:MAG: hypothetical protein JOY58_07865, partial [Solirubrobacterales bacterium]|nr:hypothetical protein [Solirubrobacterales bacterium]